MELVVLMNFFQLYNIFKVSPFPNSSLRNLKCIMITNFFLKFRTFIPIPPNKFFFFGSQNDSSEVVFFFFFCIKTTRGFMNQTPKEKSTKNKHLIFLSSLLEMTNAWSISWWISTSSPWNKMNHSSEKE